MPPLWLRYRDSNGNFGPKIKPLSLCLLSGFVTETQIPSSWLEALPNSLCLLSGFVTETDSDQPSKNQNQMSLCLLSGFVIETIPQVHRQYRVSRRYASSVASLPRRFWWLDSAGRGARPYASSVASLPRQALIFSRSEIVRIRDTFRLWFSRRSA